MGYGDNVQAEYIWIDGTAPTARLRSKTKILKDWSDHQVPSLFPVWGFDGSSTNQAEGHDSDRVLRPVCTVPDPIRRSGKNYLVLCEVENPDGTPHESNTRARLRRVLDSGASEVEPWFGIEQEYTLLKGARPFGFPSEGLPEPQGPYYCGVGAGTAIGRPLVEAHTQACLDAGLLIAGTNAEVMPGQWEFQIGTGNPLLVADHLWLARWLLYRLGEDLGIAVTLDPKPAKGDWNGAGSHTNVSTRATRDPVGGMDAIRAACEKLGQKAAEHIAVYGAGIEERLTGKHETCSYKQFKYGVADRGASIRIPGPVAAQGCGYFEDRRPCANADPYVVTARIIQTICGID